MPLSFISWSLPRPIDQRIGGGLAASEVFQGRFARAVGTPLLLTPAAPTSYTPEHRPGSFSSAISRGTSLTLFLFKDLTIYIFSELLPLFQKADLRFLVQ